MPVGLDDESIWFERDVRLPISVLEIGLEVNSVPLNLLNLDWPISFSLLLSATV